MSHRLACAVAITMVMGSLGTASGQRSQRPGVVRRYDAARGQRTDHHVLWGTFWGGVSLFSLAFHAPIVASASAGGAAYHFTKAKLVARDHLHAHEVAKKVGWGTFWTGIGLFGAAVAGPLVMAVGGGFAAYNFFRASSLYRDDSR